MENIEEFDKLKTQVLKYVLYKKRSEAEVRQKFLKNTGNMLDNVIEYLDSLVYNLSQVPKKKDIENALKTNNDELIGMVANTIKELGITKENLDKFAEKL